MYKHLLVAVSALFLFGCEKKPKCPADTWTEEYTLDVSNIEQRGGPDNVPYKSALSTYNPVMMTVFPLDLSSQNRVLDKLDAETINLIQTKSYCADMNGRTELPDDHEIVRNIAHPLYGGTPAFKDAAHVAGIHVELPYVQHTWQGMSWIGKPGKLAVAFHIKDKGWVMHFTCIEPILDDTAQKGIAEIKVDESNVDAIGIHFHDVTTVNKITYTVKKTCAE